MRRLSRSRGHTCADPADACSLRAAIEVANADTPNVYQIDVMAGTITLLPANGELGITGNVLITGKGSATTILDATGCSCRVLHLFRATSYPTIHVSKLAIRHGNAGDGRGGGIRIDEAAVSLDRLLVSDNAATDGGGIHVDAISMGRGRLGAVTITGVTNTISGAPNGSEGVLLNGGAMSITVEAQLARVSIANVRSEARSNGPSGVLVLGGGIAAPFARLVVSRSTIADVTAVVHQADAEVRGGAVYAGRLQLVNVTLAGTAATATDGGAARGGAIYVTDTGDLVNVTIDRASATTQGAAIEAQDGPITVRQAIISRTSGSPACGTRGTGAVASGGYNLTTTNACGFAMVGDIQKANAGLGVLAKNGGPTRTLALLAGSPAIDAGGPACVARDQRGLPRPKGRACDIGAFEVQ